MNEEASGIYGLTTRISNTFLDERILEHAQEVLGDPSVPNAGRPATFSSLMDVATDTRTNRNILFYIVGDATKVGESTSEFILNDADDRITASSFAHLIDSVPEGATPFVVIDTPHADGFKMALSKSRGAHLFSSNLDYEEAYYDLDGSFSNIILGNLAQGFGEAYVTAGDDISGWPFHERQDFTTPQQQQRRKRPLPDRATR